MSGSGAVYQPALAAIAYRTGDCGLNSRNRCTNCAPAEWPHRWNRVSVHLLDDGERPLALRVHRAAAVVVSEDVAEVVAGRTRPVVAAELGADHDVVGLCRPVNPAAAVLLGVALLAVQYQQDVRGAAQRRWHHQVRADVVGGRVHDGLSGTTPPDAAPGSADRAGVVRAGGSSPGAGATVPPAVAVALNDAALVSAALFTLGAGGL